MNENNISDFITFGDNATSSTLPQVSIEMHEMSHSNADNDCSNLSQHNTLRLSNRESLDETLDKLTQTLCDSSRIIIEIHCSNEHEEISFECFIRIKKLFDEQKFRLLLIKCDAKNANDFLLWMDPSQRHIFMLKIKEEKEKISSYVTKFLTESLNNGQNGLWSGFKYDKTNVKVETSIFFLSDTRDYDLLLIAAESGDVEAVRILLKLDFNVHIAVDGVTAMDLAYEKKHFGVMLELLKNHALYPDNFSTDGISDELKAFINISNLMHESIQDKNKEKVTEILSENPNLKFFYDTKNNSALTCALVNRSFKVYEDFLLRNISFGPKEAIDDILDQLDITSQETLHEIHEKYSKPLIQKHLMILLANTSVGHDNENDPEKISAITLAYQTLDKDPRLSQILKVVAASRNFKITFDFERDSVRILDPSVEGYANGMFYSSGKILVAAQDLMTKGREHVTYGVIAHELCHFAIFSTFDNDAKPYSWNDKVSKNIFESVVLDCKEKVQVEEIVDSVFESYPEKMIEAELAVRYAHMLGHYHNEPDVMVQRNVSFSSLKTFHEEKVMPAMEQAIQTLEAKADIKGQYKNARKTISTMRKIIFFLLALLCFGAPLIYYFAQGPTRVWKDLDQNEKLTIKNNFVKYRGVEVRFGDLFDDNSTAFDDLNAHQIAEGLENNSKGINEAFNSILHHKVVLIWKNCTKPLKEKILNASINFQGEKVEVGKVLDFDSPPLFELKSDQIKSLIEERGLTLGQKFIPPTSFFIERRFKIVSIECYQEENFRSKNLTSEQKIQRFKHSRLNAVVNDAIDEVYREGFFFLSDGPGSGKSTVFKHFPKNLKQAHPDFWVAFVTLKDHAETYKKLQIFSNFSSIIGEKILKLEGLELSVFKELFDKGKVAFVWDAFDEVKVESRDHFLKALKILKTQTENFNFLSSRPEHQKNITQALSAKVFKLVPFDLKDREKFFTESLKTLSKTERKSIKEKIQNFIERGQEGNSDEDRTINNPLMLHILSEVLKNDKNVNLKNRYEIYQKFVEKQINTIDSSRILALAHKGINLKSIHKVYAVSCAMHEIVNFSREEKIPLEIVRKVTFLKIFHQKIALNATEIAEFGLMTVTNDGNLEFVHKTFEEFFIASFIAEEIFELNEVVTKEELGARFVILQYNVLYKQVLSFLFDFLRFSSEDFHPFNEKSFESLNFFEANIKEEEEEKDWIKGFSLIINLDFFVPLAEILRRFFLKYSRNFEKYIFNEEIDNSLKWLKENFQIDAKSMEKLSVLNDPKLILEEFKENHQMANIFFKIWFHFNRGEISVAYLINNYTGLNLDSQSLKKFGSQENVNKILEFISENFTKNEQEKFIRINFVEIFFGDLNAEVLWEIWQKFVKILIKEEMEQIIFKLLHRRTENVFDVITKMKNSTIVELMLKEFEKFLKFNTTLPEIWRFPTKNACKNNFQVLRVYWSFVEKYKNGFKLNSFCSSEELLVVLQNGKALEEIKNIYDFYEEFFDRKFKLRNKTDKRKKIRKLHQLAALDSVFIEKNLGDFIKKRIEEANSKVKQGILSKSNQLTSIGLVTISDNKHFQFGSKALEDFFVANNFAEKIYLGSLRENDFLLPMFLLESRNVNLFLQKFFIRIHDKKVCKDKLNLNVFIKYILFISTKKGSLIKDNEVMKRLLLEIETKDIDHNLQNIFLRLGLEIKDFENLNDFYWSKLKEDFKIENDKDDENDKFNDTIKTFETYERNNQKGNILIKIWFYYRRDEYSSCYLINKYTGLNLDDKILTEIGEQENFFDFYEFISQSLTENDKAKMFEMNFEEIFLVDYKNGEIYWKAWQKLTESVKSNETIGKLLQKSNRRQENILHIIAKISEPQIVKKILSEVEKYLEKEYLQLLIKSSTIYKEFPTFYACNNQAEVLKIFWNFITKYLKLEEQKFHLLCEIRGESNFYEACEFKESFGEIVTKEEAQSVNSSYCRDLLNE